MNEYNGKSYVVMSLEDYETLMITQRETEKIFSLDERSYSGKVALQVDKDLLYRIAERMFNASKYKETYKLKSFDTMYSMGLDIADKVVTEPEFTVESIEDEQVG